MRSSFGWGQLRPSGRRPLRCRWALQPGFCIASRGVGDGPNFLRGQAKKRWGLAKGATIPLAAFFAYFLSHHRK